ncbi:MAG: glycosyl transferase, partial [Pedobacter sp.]
EIVNELFADESKLKALKANAFEYGLHLRWPSTGDVFVDVLNEAIDKYLSEKETGGKPIIDPDIMPAFNLAHIQRLTDDTGIVQHAKYGIPNLKEGYCVDDNARALILTILAYQQNKSKVALDLLPIYLSYIQYMQCDNGNFRNFLSFRREYLDEVGTEDSFGRTIWSLGYLINNAPNNSYREFAKELFLRSVPHFKDLKHLRGLGNTIIGLTHFIKAHPNDEHIKDQLDKLAEPLKAAYRKNKQGHWHWFEEKMTYDNAILPLALMSYYEISKDQEAYDIAFESMEYLTQKTLIGGYLNPVGNDGWLFRDGGDMAIYDQQAIETMAMVLMYFKAYEITHDKTYIKQMYVSYQWFLGENILRIPLFDHETKGCADGLQTYGINRNQGAESTLAYWISHLVVLKAMEFEYEFIQSSDLKAAQNQTF